MHIFLNDLDLAKMTRAHGQYIFWWHRQSLCHTLASYLFPLHCMAFTGLKMTFNFHKWHLVHVTIMSLEETSNVFFHKKDMDQTQTINSFFSYSDLGLSIKNLKQNYDTPSNH